MEALYKKLYDKYTKLKTRKMSELDNINKDQEAKFLHFVSAAEELIQHLKSENDGLRVQVNELRCELASIRSYADEKCADYQKLLMEENQKNSNLSEEVEKLRKIQLEAKFSGFNNGNSNEHLDTPSHYSQIPDKVSKGSSGRNTRKRSRVTPESEKPRVICVSAQDDALLRQPTPELSQNDMPSTVGDIQQPECCGRNADQSDVRVNASVSTSFPYQCLLEYLIGMELSTTNQNEAICISALHKSSGYSFSLTWVNKLGGDIEIQYHVLSLGSFERVAPEWMKGDIMFSTTMCPIFFERVTKVIKLHC